MDIRELRKVAKERLKGFCRVCDVCNGVVCAGEVPGMGGIGTGSSFRANLEALERYKFNMRSIHDVRNPITTFKLWDETLSFPVLAAPMTGVSYNMGGALTEAEFIDDIISGSLMANTIGMCGDGADPTFLESGLKAIKRNNGKGIAIIKPRKYDEIIKRIQLVEEAGAIAVGIDVDAAGLVIMAMKGQPVEPKSIDELKAIIGSTKLPFIVKGIMTLSEAIIAAECGASAIVVSNHGGRILDHTLGAADVLPEIAINLKNKILIFADGGVRSGADVLKLLALGADAVLLGRPLIIGAFGGRREGVAFILDKIRSELTHAMLLTGVENVKNVSRDILVKM
ncbi:MAG: alpha-hydroxy-acid oxidizing protein [Thermodesulfovibrionales bacterium]|nr:alpha-hydroxy-acid oxidizing protein [Thermodesulfovibrionales bacterium]